MARNTLTPLKSKSYRQGVRIGTSGWMLLPGRAGWSGSGGEPQTTPISTDDETYLLPGDTPPPSISVPISVLEPVLDVYGDLQSALQSGDPISYIRESDKRIPIKPNLPATAMVEVPAAAEDPVVGKGWKKLVFSGAGTPDWESDATLKVGMEIEITGGENLIVQHIGAGDGVASTVYVSGDAAADAAAVYKVSVPRRQQGPILCTVTASPQQTDETGPDSAHSGTLTLAPTGSIPNWKSITDAQAVLDF